MQPLDEDGNLRDDFAEERLRDTARDDGEIVYVDDHQQQSSQRG